MDEAKIKAAAEAVAKAEQADVLLFNGDIQPDCAHSFLDKLRPRKRAKKVILLLVTPGGDPDAAFKIGRTLQNLYERVVIFVPGWCKSAGTLIALAAHELIISDEGELGPLDIQIAKADEIMELGSGLTVDAAMKSLEATASKMVLNLMVSIRRDTGGSITTRTAADLAAKMVTGLLEPIYRQIDPLKIGENSRAMNITKGYGARLNLASRNLRNSQSLDFLVSAYPDHSFVIDRTEAKLLFIRVSEPNELLTSLMDAMEKDALLPTQQGGSPTIRYLSGELPQKPRSDTPDAKPGPTPRIRPRPRPGRARGNGGAAKPARNGA